MRRHRWLLILVLLFALPALAETILLLPSGERVRVEGELQFDGREFVLPDGRRFDRDAVNEVRFEADMPGGMTDLVYNRERYEKLFAKGRELAERYPNRPGIILEDLNVVRLEDNGEQSNYYHFTGLVLKEKAKNWATAVIGGDPIRTRMNGPFGMVVHPDGTYRFAGESDRTQYKPYAGAVFFARYIVKKLTIPDVNVGDIVEFWYKTTDFRPINPDFFFPAYYFQDSSPMALSRIEIRVPADKPLYWDAKNFPPGKEKPRRAEHPDGGLVYTWEMTDVPPFEDEPGMPNRGEIIPNVRTTVMKNWDPIFDHLSDFYRTRMIVTDDIRTLTEQVVGDATDVHEKIGRIYHYVQRKIRYISIKTDFATGFTGHAAQVTHTNGYGDCTDKSILLATMLKAIGVEAHPVALHTWGGRRDIYSLPNLAGNHAINRVFLDGEDFFLDATAETYRYPTFRWDDHGRPFIDALAREIGVIDRPASDTNLDRQQWDITLDETGGASVTLGDAPTGVFEAMVRSMLERFDSRRREIMLQQMILAWGAGAKLVSFQDDNVDDITRPLTQELRFALPQMAQKSGGLWVIELPGLPSRFSQIDKPERRLDLLSPFCYRMQREYRVTLPSNWRLVDWPKKTVVDTPLLRFTGEYKPTDDGFAVAFSMDHYNDQTVTPEQYPAYRQSLVEVEAFFARRVFAEEVQP